MRNKFILLAVEAMLAVVNFAVYCAYGTPVCLFLGGLIFGVFFFSAQQED